MFSLFNSKCFKSKFFSLPSSNSSTAALYTITPFSGRDIPKYLLILKRNYRMNFSWASTMPSGKILHAQNMISSSIIIVCIWAGSLLYNYRLLNYCPCIHIAQINNNIPFNYCIKRPLLYKIMYHHTLIY